MTFFIRVGANAKSILRQVTLLQVAPFQAHIGTD